MDSHHPALAEMVRATGKDPWTMEATPTEGFEHYARMAHGDPMFYGMMEPETSVSALRTTFANAVDGTVRVAQAIAKRTPVLRNLIK